MFFLLGKGIDGEKGGRVRANEKGKIGSVLFCPPPPPSLVGSYFLRLPPPPPPPGKSKYFIVSLNLSNFSQFLTCIWGSILFPPA